MGDVAAEKDPLGAVTKDNLIMLFTVAYPLENDPMVLALPANGGFPLAGRMSHFAEAALRGVPMGPNSPEVSTAIVSAMAEAHEWAVLQPQPGMSSLLKILVFAQDLNTLGALPVWFQPVRALEMLRKSHSGTADFSYVEEFFHKLFDTPMPENLPPHSVVYTPNYREFRDELVNKSN